MSTWYSFFGISDNGYPINEPYTAFSPTLREDITFDKNEIWVEIERILAEDKKKKFTAGQQLYHNVHFCISPYFFFDQESNMYLEELSISKRLKIPLARSVDESQYERLVILSAISEEIDACNILNQKKNNGKK